MRDFKLPIESEKTLIEKKTDVAIYREINIDCWEREITMRIYRLVFLSRWATATQWSVFWREIPSSSRRPRSLPESGKWRSNQNSNCVNFLRKYEYYQNKWQPTQSNITAEVSRVSGRSHSRQRNPSSSLHRNASSASSSHFRPMTNMRQIGISDCKRKRKQSILGDLIIFTGPTVNVVPQQGKRVTLSEHGHVPNACQFFKVIVMEAFEETIPRLVDIEVLMSVHNKLVKPSLTPGQKGIIGVILQNRFFKNKYVYVRPSKVLLPRSIKGTICSNSTWFLV